MRFFSRDDRPQIFRDFENLRPVVPDHFEVNFLGGLTRDTFCAIRRDETVSPGVGEEFFEFMSILEAAKAAGDCFTFVELGAGFGRWSCVAAMAARRVAKDYRLYLVEAEPQHLEWIPMHMADNDINPGKYTVMPYAVGETGTIPFFVQGPAELGATNPWEWYGQSVVDREQRAYLTQADGLYFGRPLQKVGNFFSIDIEAKPLLDLIGHLAHIDLIDMDIQGAELSVIEQSIGFLNATTRRMHIETHSAAIEEGLRAILTLNGWRAIHDFPQATKGVMTPFGKADFIGGLIDCVNLRFG
jgi:FkbM family methyltransferase